jgi:sodium-dependent dicarboxylate transporter 2/3/5
MLASTPPEGMAPMACRVAAVASLMGVLWITEALPVAATALIPLAAFPLLGVGTMSKTAAP